MRVRVRHSSEANPENWHGQLVFRPAIVEAPAPGTSSRRVRGGPVATGAEVVP
jgi:hypothetical protein